jgi:hypothetical protein
VAKQTLKIRASEYISDNLVERIARLRIGQKETHPNAWKDDYRLSSMPAEKLRCVLCCRLLLDKKTPETDPLPKECPHCRMYGWWRQELRRSGMPLSAATIQIHLDNARILLRLGMEKLPDPHLAF